MSAAPTYSRELADLERSRPILVETLGIPDVFVEHGSREKLLSGMGLDADSIAAVGKALAERAGVKKSARETA